MLYYLKVWDNFLSCYMAEQHSEVLLGSLIEDSGV